jgi:hypothetical protein
LITLRLWPLTLERQWLQLLKVVIVTKRKQVVIVLMPEAIIVIEIKLMLLVNSTADWKLKVPLA